MATRPRSEASRRGDAVSANGAGAKAPIVTSDDSNGHGPYVVPVVHFQLSERAVNAGFWGALIGASALGALDLPLAALIGAGVVVARHHAGRSNGSS